MSPLLWQWHGRQTQRGKVFSIVCLMLLQKCHRSGKERTQLLRCQVGSSSMLRNWVIRYNDIKSKMGYLGVSTCLATTRVASKSIQVPLKFHFGFRLEMRGPGRNLMNLILETKSMDALCQQTVWQSGQIISK